MSGYTSINIVANKFKRTEKLLVLKIALLIFGVKLFIDYFVCGICSQPQQKNDNAKPNIVFILADDLGFADPSYHGKYYGSQIQTPFIDFLATRGVRLENYYVQNVCSPTRGQLLTGRYSIHTGLQHRHVKVGRPFGLPLDNILLPEQLKHCGYKTYMLGKWHLGYHTESYTPWKRGFDEYFGYLGGSCTYYAKYRPAPARFENAGGIDMFDSKSGPTNSTWGEYSTHMYARKAKEIIEKHDKSKPMFLYLALQAVHRPFESPPSKYVTPYNHISVRGRRIFAAMVGAMDEAIKNISMDLMKADMWENTILIFSTDNGGAVGYKKSSNWPLRGGKSTLWEGGIKAVGFVHGAPIGLKGTNAINRELIHVSDWLPTILSATSCQLMDGTPPLDGVDQWDTIRLNKPTKRKEILLNIDADAKKRNELPIMRSGFDINVQAGIISGQWKLLTGISGDGGSKWESNSWVAPEEAPFKSVKSSDETNLKLFDLSKDPLEKYNLADSNTEVVDTLLRRLAEYNTTAVPPLLTQFKTFDEKCLPSFHGGYWVPWIDQT